jgi:AcrR family transcriptional regulator
MGHMSRTTTPSEAVPRTSDKTCTKRTLRADAERNRALLVDAARDVFAEQGLDASLNEVARRAGVGVATLFRRFPSRDDLVAAVFEKKMSAYEEATAAALDDPDPWHGFCAYVERLCEMQAEDRGFADVLNATFPLADRLQAARDRAAVSLREVIGRAQHAGRLRADFVHQDLPLVLMANAGVVAGTRHGAPDAWRRLLAYLLQAFAAGAAEPLPAPPSKRQMYRALKGLGTASSSNGSRPG